MKPRGAPLDSATLQGHSISSALAHDYVKSGWLKRLGRGVFMFAGDELERDPTLRFLERKMSGLHVAAKTALAWHGFRQNVAHGETLILWGSRKSTLPSWFLDRFPARYSAAQLFDDKLPADFGLAPMPESPDGPKVSVSERALLEMLSEVGVHQQIEEARGIMESVRQLRSRQLATLLDARRRLFTELPGSLTDKQRAFLLGLVQGKPDWSLMSCPHLREMPAIRWKLDNLSRLKQSNPRKFALQATDLETRLLGG